MPVRTLKDSICTSEGLALLSPRAEILYYRLIVTVDDYGRADARPVLLRARCLPLLLDRVSDADVRGWLAELASAGLVELYSADGHPYLQIVDWAKQQRSPRALESRCPEPPAESTNRRISESPNQGTAGRPVQALQTWAVEGGARADVAFADAQAPAPDVCSRPLPASSREHAPADVSGAPTAIGDGGSQAVTASGNGCRQMPASVSNCSREARIGNREARIESASASGTRARAREGASGTAAGRRKPVAGTRSSDSDVGQAKTWRSQGPDEGRAGARRSRGGANVTTCQLANLSTVRSANLSTVRSANLSTVRSASLPTCRAAILAARQRAPPSRAPLHRPGRLC